MSSIDTSSGAQSGTEPGAAKGPDKQPATTAAASNENHPAVLGQAGSAAAVVGSPPDKGSLPCQHASKKCAMGSVHFAAEVVVLAPHQDKSPAAQSGSGIAQQEEQQQHLVNEPIGKHGSQQQCKSDVSSVGFQQPITSRESADHGQRVRPTGPRKVKEAGPVMKADGNASSRSTSGSTNATEIAAPMPRYIGTFIADFDPQIIRNRRSKQKRGFTFQSKGAEGAPVGSPCSSGAVVVGSARAGKSTVKP